MEETYRDGQGRTRYSTRVTHTYCHRGPHDHDYQVCQVTPCPLRNAANRLRHKRWRVRSSNTGSVIETNADHVDLAASLDDGEDYWCYEHAVPIVGTRVA